MDMSTVLRKIHDEFKEVEIHTLVQLQSKNCGIVSFCHVFLFFFSSFYGGGGLIIPNFSSTTNEDVVIRRRYS